MRTAAVALAALLLAGCSSGDEAPAYDASDYRDGDCREAAESVFAIERAVRPEVVDDAAPGRAVADLTASQKTLIPVVAGIGDAAVKADAERVVKTVGFYRIGVDAQNFTPKLASAVHTSAVDFLKACAA